MVQDEMMVREGERVQGAGREDAIASLTGQEETLLQEAPLPAGNILRDPGEEEGDPLPELTGLTDDEMDLDLGEWTGGQEEKEPRWIIGAALSPLYSFRDAEAGAVSNAGDFESGLLAYAGGVHVSYQAAGRVAIE